MRQRTTPGNADGANVSPRYATAYHQQLNSTPYSFTIEQQQQQQQSVQMFQQLNQQQQNHGAGTPVVMAYQTTTHHQALPRPGHVQQQQNNSNYAMNRFKSPLVQLPNAVLSPSPRVSANTATTAAYAQLQAAGTVANAVTGYVHTHQQYPQVQDMQPEPSHDFIGSAGASPSFTSPVNMKSSPRADRSSHSGTKPPLPPRVSPAHYNALFQVSR